MEKWTAGIFIGEKAIEEKAKRRAKTLAGIEAHFRDSLETTEPALALSCLEEDERRDIEHAIHWIKFWLPVFLKSDDVDDVREAGDWLAAYNRVIGARCETSKTEAHYWEIKKRGGPRKHLSKRSKETLAWHAYINVHLSETIRLRPSFSPEELAEEFMLDNGAPKSMPKKVDTVTRFIRKLLKEREREKSETIGQRTLRLVSRGRGVSPRLEVLPYGTEVLPNLEPSKSNKLSSSATHCGGVFQCSLKDARAGALKPGAPPTSGS
jgi:hypothetical protein